MFDQVNSAINVNLVNSAIINFFWSTFVCFNDRTKHFATNKREI